MNMANLCQSNGVNRSVTRFLMVRIQSFAHIEKICYLKALPG